MPVNSTPDNASYVSVGVPRGASPMGSLYQDLRNATNVCFGGKLFLSKNYHNQTMICHAVSNPKREAIQELSQVYNAFNALTTMPFLTYKGSKPGPSGNGQVIFTFVLAENCRSMRQVMTSDDHAEIGMQLFPKLVDILTKYKNMADYKYALCCISLDTVFVTAQGEILLLPLQCPNRDYPRGFPLEAGTNEADERTDLYTAALLTLQVVSGCEYESRAEKKRMCPELVSGYVMDCLCVFPSGRKTLAQTRNLIAGESRDAAKTQAARADVKPPRRSRKPIGYDAAGNPIYDDAPTEQKSFFRFHKAKSASPVPEEPDAPAPTNIGINAILAPLQNLRHIWAAPEEETSGTADYPFVPSRPAPSTPRRARTLDGLEEDPSDYFVPTRFSTEAESNRTNHYAPGIRRQAREPEDDTADCLILTDEDDA